MKEKERKVTQFGGHYCDEKVRLVAQEASLEEMVVDVSCGMKEKRLIDERKELAVAILLPTRSWVATEGWDAFVHDNAVVEVVEEATKMEGKERRPWWKQN